MREVVVGLTTGCFDVLHHGHLIYLQRCRSLCDRLIVAVDSDELVRAAKGPNRPIVPESERLELINSLKVVSSAFILRDVKRLDGIVRRFKVRLMFKNNPFWDMLCDEKVIHGLEDTDVELVIVPDIPGMPTTTNMVKRIVERYRNEEKLANLVGESSVHHIQVDEGRQTAGNSGGPNSDMPEMLYANGGDRS